MVRIIFIGLLILAGSYLILGKLILPTLRAMFPKKPTKKPYVRGNIRLYEEAVEKVVEASEKVEEVREDLKEELGEEINKFTTLKEKL